MTVAGDQLTRRYSTRVLRRVRAIRRDVEGVVRESGLPARGSVERVAHVLAEPLLTASWLSTRDQLDHARAYAELEDAPPPSTPAPAVPSAETEEGVAGLAIAMRAVIKEGRKKQRGNSVISDVLAVVVGSQASRAVMHDARRWSERYLTTDRSVRAYRRVPDEDPCWWCAMLASRGFTYRSRRSAGDVRVAQGWHPACACTTQAAFVGQELPALDPVTAEAQRVYDESTGPHTGKEKARAFRRAWEDRRHT